MNPSNRYTTLLYKRYKKGKCDFKTYETRLNLLRRWDTMYEVRRLTGLTITI